MRSENAAQLSEIAKDFAASLRPSAFATLVVLSGELGAGKTTFVQAVAKYFGVSETVSSPTFVIEKVYPIRDAARSNGAGEQRSHFKQLVHIDAYRLKSADELTRLGWDELLADSANLILLEWPERVSEIIPEGAMKVRIDIDGDGRIITIDGQEKS